MAKILNLLFIFIGPILIASCFKQENHIVDSEMIYVPKELSSYDVRAQDSLSEIELFRRCYHQLLRAPLKEDHPLLKKIKSGDIEGSKGCYTLIDDISLDSDGRIVEKWSNDRQISRTLHKLHNTWFPNAQFATSNDNWGTALVQDSEEMALYITKSLLSEEVSASYIVTAKNALEAKRKSSNSSDYLMIYPGRLETGLVKDFEFLVGYNHDSPQLWMPAPKKVAQGVLFGVKEVPGNRDVLNFLGSEMGEDKHNLNIDINKNFGAGAIGSSAYILLNNNLDDGQTTDGGNALHRRWAHSVFKDVLCRDLPLVKLKDAKDYVIDDSEISFQRSEQCMSCHTSTDPMAGVLRNIEQGLSNMHGDNVDIGEREDVYNLQVRALHEHRPRWFNHKDIFMGKRNKDFYRSQPRGDLIFRNIYGQLVKAPASDISELGQQISKQDDFYICLAKRYLNFFTGIDVDLNRLSQEYAKADNKDRYIADFIVSLGLNLKESQNLKYLIKEIISSPLYNSKNFSVEVL